MHRRPEGVDPLRAGTQPTLTKVAARKPESAPQKTEGREDRLGGWAGGHLEGCRAVDRSTVSWHHGRLPQVRRVGDQCVQRKGHVRN